MFVYLFLLFSQFLFSADTYQLTYKLNVDTGDFNHFLEKMKQEQWENPESFLNSWKNDHPNYFNQYVLAYRSRSLQQASPTHPRVILFSENADFVMSFNGHRRQRGFQNIEMMRFDHVESRFEFYEMSFENDQAQLSEANPAKCLECHQGASRSDVDPRPNWEPYNSWFGFFGSLDDDTRLFKKNFINEYGLDTPEQRFLIEEFDNEEKWLEEFWQEIKPNDARYQLLDPIYNANYSREKTINGDLTNRLSVLNHRRLARLMRAEVEVYQKVKWAIWGFAQCGQELHVSEEVLLWLREITPLKENYEERGAAVNLYCGEYHQETDECLYKTPYPKVRPVTKLSEAINLMYEAFGVDTEDWSMDFKTGGRFAAFERFGLTNDPRPPMRKAVFDEFSKDPDFKNVSCSQVKAESLKQLGDLSQVKAFREQMLKLREEKTESALRAEKPLINRCISCHVDKGFGDIPYIPFDQPTQMKMRLSQTGYKRGTLKEEILYRIGPHAGMDEQMPPRGLPTEEQRLGLLKFIEGLIE